MTDTASETRANDERPMIAHPVWCKAETPDCARLTGHWEFTAPGEDDETHRGRVYHLEASDVTVAFGLIQTFETAPWIEGVCVSPAVIDFTVTDHTSYNADSGTWLGLADAKAMRRLLDRAIDDLERWPRLPVTEEA